jgi:hypothetical protein
VVFALFFGFGLVATLETPPSAAPAALREIGPDRAAGSVCGTLVVHANGAIAAALHDDQVVDRAIERLRSIDFDSNGPARRNGLAELGRLAVEVQEQSLRGDDELRRLNDLAARLETARRDDVRSFGNALGAAFARQRAMAADLAGLVAYFNYRDIRGDENPPDDVSRGPSELLGRTAQSSLPAVRSPYSTAGTPNQMAARAALDLTGRAAGIRADEARAADHSEPAVSGCS